MTDMPEIIYVEHNKVFGFLCGIDKNPMEQDTPYIRADIAERNARIAAIVEKAFPQLASIELAVAQGFLDCAWVGNMDNQDGQTVTAADFLDNFLWGIKAAMEGDNNGAS